MAITTANIDIGNLPNDGTGDPLRTAFEKINENFNDLVGALPEGPNGSFQFNDNGNSLGTANFAYVSSNNTIQLGANILPVANVTIGTSSNTITGLYLGKNSLKVGNVSINELNNTITFPLTVLPTVKANIAVNNITSDGNVTITDTLNVNGVQVSSIQAVTTTNSSDQVIAMFSEPSFNLGTFKINSREDATNNSQSATVVAYKSNNGGSIKYVVSGTIFVGTPLTDYNVGIDGYGSVTFMVSPFLNSTLTHTINYEIAS